MDTKVVNERLGHATPGFTANTYPHVLPGLQAQAAERLKLILQPPAPATGKPGSNGRRRAR